MGFYICCGSSSFSWSRCPTCIWGQPKLEELLREETWSACSTGFSIIPYLCWHRYLYNCTMKLASQEQFSWKQTKQQQQQVSSPKAMAFSRATRLLFIQLCPPSGLEKEVKVTALQKDGYLPFSLLNGIKWSWDNEFQSRNTDSLALSRAGGRQGDRCAAEIWAMGNVPGGQSWGRSQIEHFTCRSAALRPAGYWHSQVWFVEPPNWSQLLFSPSRYQVMNHECFYAMPFSKFPLLLLKLSDLGCLLLAWFL